MSDFNSVDDQEWQDEPAEEPNLGWMENYPLHLVKKIAKGGNPEGKRVAVLELQRRLHRRPSAS